MPLLDPFPVQPFLSPFCGKISVPGSKSLTNRVFPLAALGVSPVKIFGALESEDAFLMREALKKMGVSILSHIKNKREVFTVSSGSFFKNAEDAQIFCGNSGTTIRFLTALCLLRPKGTKTTLTGIERMKERPIGDLVDALLQMGARIEYLDKEGFPPLAITGMGKSLPGGKISMKGNLSSQFFTAVLQIGAFCEKPLEIEVIGDLVSQPYIAMTIKILEPFGVRVENENFKKFVITPQKIQVPNQYFIEGDASSASYPLAIAAITGGNIIIENLPEDSLQGDSQFFTRVLKKMRGTVETRLIASLQPLGDINLEDMPDTAMTAVVLAAYATGRSKITGLSTLRHKECDRIWALEKNLKAMGANIITGEDWIEIFGDPKLLHGATIETFHDHRVAMCFAVLGSVIAGVEIENPQCTEKTYPSFWDDLEEWRKMD
ncbi:MAG: 3-phosphoshikimate 1-carboxyvinyltransferase [Candidatus Peregrinibacteria bacterium]